ncbi:hypothetical protein H6A08_07365 [Enorma massiliensis]|uniref:polysialyltransferase family glycosyltransferase n=1 Tax=Enorma massiliensis TaxID=1472761 RepID=UPI001959F4CB|nr:polysialyltransferase family glycosyltransferase [Enorma massiliensis]MBM6784178.1 hypothetical protein [Enorma massiliensis]
MIAQSIPVESNSLFLADTPLQVLNSAVISKMNCTGESKTILLVYCQFADSETMVQWAKRTGYFTRVIALSPQYASVWGHRFRYIEVFLGKKFLNLNPCVLEGISDFYCSCATEGAQEVYIRLFDENPKVKVHFYEDGTGTYTGKIFQGFYYRDTPPKGIRQRSRLAAIVKRVVSNGLFRHRGKYKVSSIYVKRPDAVLYERSDLIKSMNSISFLGEEALDELSSSIHIPPRSVIVFDTVRNQSDDALSLCIDRLITLALENGATVFVKKHPRDKVARNYPDGVYALEGVMWEALCCKSDLSDSILIGVASTALLSPVIETGVYPVIIDLLKVVKPEAFDAEKQPYPFLELARKLYGRDVCRINVPASAFEAEEDLLASLGGV